MKTVFCNGNEHQKKDAIFIIFWVFFHNGNGYQWTNAICIIYWMLTFFAMEIGINGLTMRHKDQSYHLFFFLMYISFHLHVDSYVR